jgi:FkbM family methyltransferase
MTVKNVIIKAIELALNPREIYALLTWPKFSMTSYRMVSALKQQGVHPQTIIDVGANVGQFTVAAAKLFPKRQIHSFEPLPEAVTLLKKHVRKLKNITVYPLALGDNEGEISFHVNTDSRSSSILPLAEAHRAAFSHAHEIKTVPVKISTLDKVFNLITLEPPVLLKLDVQGYEATTLRGGRDTLKRIDYVILEASFKPMYEGEMLFMDIVRLMEEYGFQFLRPVGWLSHPKTGEILQMDALFAGQS